MANFNIGYFDDVSSRYQSESSTHPFSTIIGKGSDNTDSYAEWTIVQGKSAQSHVYYRFDVSSIPKDATINSVNCTARVARQNSRLTEFSSLTLKIVVGALEETEHVTVKNDESVAVYDLPSINKSRDLLTTVGISLHSSRGFFSSTTDFWVRLYGATLSVDFTAVGGSRFLLKTNGVWIEGSQLYKKVNGVWVLQEDLSNVFESGIKYK
jgi:hypothetical protein